MLFASKAHCVISQNIDDNSCQARAELCRGFQKKEENRKSKDVFVLWLPANQKFKDPAG